MYMLCASLLSFFFFKQKTAYEMRISDWSSDVCSSDLPLVEDRRHQHRRRLRHADQRPGGVGARARRALCRAAARQAAPQPRLLRGDRPGLPEPRPPVGHALRWRGLAHEDEPPPRLVAHRRHLRLRRPAHPADPPPPPPAERPPPP